MNTIKGSQVQAFRKKLGIQQPEFGRLLGYRRGPSISDVENNKKELTDEAKYFLAQIDSEKFKLELTER